MMKFKYQRGYSFIECDNGIVMMSIRDYIYYIRGGVTETELKLNENDVPSYVFFNQYDDEIPYLGVAYNSGKYAIIGGRNDQYLEYNDMIRYLLNE